MEKLSGFLTARCINRPRQQDISHTSEGQMRKVRVEALHLGIAVGISRAWNRSVVGWFCLSGS